LAHGFTASIPHPHASGERRDHGRARSSMTFLGMLVLVRWSC
jgi:hypothetical protein